MTYTLDQFCEDCRNSILENPGTAGREAIRVHMEKLLANPGFVEERLGENVEPGRHTLYHDPETDVHVLAHIYKDPVKSVPHDHGRSWAVYGSITRHTDIAEWKRTDGSAGDDDVELEVDKEYRLKAGSAGLFDVGMIHSIDVPADTRFLRVTGTDLDSVETSRFDLENKKVMRTVRQPATAG